MRLRNSSTVPRGCSIRPMIAAVSLLPVPGLDGVPQPYPTAVCAGGQWWALTCSMWGPKETWRSVLVALSRGTAAWPQQGSSMDCSFPSFMVRVDRCPMAKCPCPPSLAH